MRQFFKLKKIIFIILIFSSINIFEGCTSIQETFDKNIGYDLFKIDKDNDKQENVTKTQNENNGIQKNNTDIKIEEDEIHSGDIKSQAENNQIQDKNTKSQNRTTKTQTENRILNYDEVKDTLIRFHVIANSDKDEDQNLKLKVKNQVIDYLYPYLNASQSLEQSRKIIKDKMDEVKKLAEQVIKDNNYKYGVKAELSRENFPEKSYGKITLPQGNYEAFRIIIGSGQGKNWWCVMFPPLCFVDETKAEVEYDKTENRLNSKKSSSGFKIDFNFGEDKSEELDTQNNKEGSEQSDNEQDSEEQISKEESDKQEDKGESDQKYIKAKLDKQENNKEENKEDVQIKFKIVEIFKSLFN
ncbi:stage II sporulation protein SpoIIR [Clostridium puniceum]|uniref:Stage II sporulation protein SpoIIR n=1 Tax=Clostridium puniceum TaxID=29367 RepID=A0A1S8T011_9CLOT|nr:stage II sporulation protein SpoIIR [Clostridium puniceum]